jgi:putative oxidoreductase
MTSAAYAAVPARRTGLHVTLWVVQVLLAAMFLMAGVMKLTQPIATLATSLPWATSVPELLVRFIGAAELAGALGLVLPSLTRIQPRLTALAALGLAVVMLLAAGFHATRGEYAMLPMNLAIGLVALFVAWGRGKAAPISPRN